MHVFELDITINGEPQMVQFETFFIITVREHSYFGISLKYLIYTFLKILLCKTFFYLYVDLLSFNKVKFFVFCFRGSDRMGHISSISPLLALSMPNQINYNIYLPPWLQLGTKITFLFLYLYSGRVRVGFSRFVYYLAICSF